MFSNVNEVVEHIRLAELGGYRFAITWGESCYRDPERSDDTWAYYFHPCYDVTAPAQAPELPRGVPVACTRDNIITPRLRDGDCNPLLLPRDRQGAHRIIQQYIRPNDTVLAGVDTFVAQHFRPRMIGLHIRGPGRTDGGVPELRRQFGANGEVPVDVFFAQVDAVVQQMPDAGILACSDSSQVIDAILARYGDRVVLWPAMRSAFGEMHADHPENTGISFDPYQLGLDVLSEALLLARTDYFVHGNSNVANFVLCKSPSLRHAYVKA